MCHHFLTCQEPSLQPVKNQGNRTCSKGTRQRSLRVILLMTPCIYTGCFKKCTTFVLSITYTISLLESWVRHQTIDHSLEFYWDCIRSRSDVHGAHAGTCSKWPPFWATHCTARRRASSATRAHVERGIARTAARIACFSVARVSGASWYTTLFRYPHK